ncbi:MAG: hypothetical protein SV686_15155 [Thermodesulfobacteriota bacterium]|nr:hypothetical protein [Thermodesulfobacteriota bacterium]
MKPHIKAYFCFFLVLVLVGAGLSFGPIITGRAVAFAEEEVEVLTRGPIHEAFAETVEFDSEEGVTVQKAPPKPIEESPPDQMPEGEDVQWIPGYWAWDDEMNDYIWVSGLWRVPPPDREWVPGYWARTSEGYQWVSGYWAKADGHETEYLPEPPVTVESGPNIYAPSSEYGWIPGCWIWSRGHYLWRPGLWARMHTDWVWVPSHYKWTPRGYVFVGGYWDYLVPRRGVLFAPVYFGIHIHKRHRFRYSPVMVINLDLFFGSLFLRPRYNHYYFGDYYDVRYYRKGFFPWFSPHARRHYYDPIYTHQRWKYRHNPDWERRIKEDYRHRRDHIEARPSRKLQKMTEIRSRGWKTRDGREIIAKPLHDVSKNKDTSWRFKRVDNNHRKHIDRQKKDLSRYLKKRDDREVPKRAKKGETIYRTAEPARIKALTSPIRSKPRSQFRDKDIPPQRYKAPRVDPNVQPLKRRPQDKSRYELDQGRRMDDQQKPGARKEMKPSNRGRSSF